MNKQKPVKGIAIFCVVLVLVLVIVYSGLRILESTVFNSSDGSSQNNTSKTITRDGIDYFPRQDITVLMLIGIDRYGQLESSGFYRNDSSADVVALLIFDEKSEQCNVLYLNRDTMLEMPALGITGRRAGTYYGQLALSYSYGSGLEDSAELTRETVSNFLYGINIDYYAVMTMDAITILNDAVGGVKVNVTDDFSEVDPTITMGEITLQGEQAINFVRLRRGLGDQLNISRIERQKEYIKGFVEAFRAKKEESSSFVLSAHSEVSPYVLSDCPVNTISVLMDRFADYELAEIVSPEGESVLTDFYEFHVDEEKLDELILRLFYAPK
ncbi:MAG: LCP family protein [Oscillospiraceae bacterium]|nr:LCP family protein [Oscillospiraceae bacterium]